MCIYRSLGVVSDKIAQLSATPYKREILLRRRRRQQLLPLLLLIIIDARERVKIVANPGFGDRLRVSSVRVWARPPCVVVRDPRSMAPCVARDR